MKRVCSEQRKAAIAPKSAGSPSTPAGNVAQQPRRVATVQSAQTLRLVVAGLDRVDGHAVGRDLTGERLQEGRHARRGVRENQPRDRFAHRDRRDREHPAQRRARISGTTSMHIATVDRQLSTNAST